MTWGLLITEPAARHLRKLPRHDLEHVVAALDEMTRKAMVEHVCTSLRDYVDDEGMAAPWEAHLVTAKV